MKITRQPSFTPWPKSEITIRRTPPGLAVVGRTWPGVKPERIPYLVGDIFEGVSDDSTLQMLVDFEYFLDRGLICAPTLTGITTKLVESHATSWEHMHYWLKAFETVNWDKRPMSTMLMEFDRSGLFWESPTRSIMR